ncbi:hypothetical protein pphageT12_39 [Pseudomonas phage pphageT12]|uniref:Uncharacterized protein n=1 Tax=Pseudomonas phage phiB1_1 TaxID=2755402 RepID=A0A7D7F0P3_9CAUD|nr:hypothetical protein phiB1_1_30 [Pseudomonas phage phiB1_1]UAW53671.1 hypothetical protein pphageB21_38 [Pseudomonas phage pphageB21]UAW53730.1 hypothetical protein pphageT21_38 [Pseudomonas phage pphageT21]UAW53790.1 hypothetical protein pphageT12_39 [Pseudomonas phage pphageT12]UAW53849.1 hypothetical protein pphageBV72_37 [Pseudomonas phage pphageBV72]
MKEKNSNPKTTFTEEQYEFLSSAFPAMVIQHTHTLSEVMLGAGEQRVLELVRRNIGFRARARLRDEV